MELNNNKDAYIFFCQHQRNMGRACNNDEQAATDLDYFRALINQKRDELTTGRVVKVNGSQCLGKCRFGPNLVIFPEGIWYNYQTRKDLEEIMQKHIISGQIVRRLLSRLHQMQPKLEVV